VADESSTGAAGIAEPAGPPLPTAPWRRRTNPRVRIATAVVAAAVLASVVILVVKASAPRPAYASLPAPCAVVSLATVARYLPDPAPSPESMPADSAYQAGSCKWASVAGGEDRTLVAQVFLFDKSSEITAAQQAYNSSLSAFGCHCQGVTVGTRPVAGLGDQATAFFIADSPAAAVATAPNAAFPGTSLLVRSSNAEIALNYDAADPATGTPLASGADPGQLTGMIAVARGILTALAAPAAVASVPVSPEPHYAVPPNPCLLITTATLATYVPGATAKPQPAVGASGSTQMTSCAWTAGAGAGAAPGAGAGAGAAPGAPAKGETVLLTLASFPDAVTARQNYDLEAQANSRSISGETVTGSVWMPGLGEEGTAIFQTRSGSDQGVALIVWSGNMEINLWYASAGPVPPDRATLLTGGIAMARDVLAALPG
jgi:hypothetical protein